MNKFMLPFCDYLTKVQNCVSKTDFANEPVFSFSMIKDCYGAKFAPNRTADLLIKHHKDVLNMYARFVQRWNESDALFQPCPVPFEDFTNDYFLTGLIPNN
jgi:hypothetical protein